MRRFPASTILPQTPTHSLPPSRIRISDSFPLTMCTSSPTKMPRPKNQRKLNWIARHAQPNDLVVIYIATHGTPRSVDSAGGANYVVTYDTETYKSGNFDEDTMYATAYPIVELANAVATRMKALRTVVFLDTCYIAAACRLAAHQEISWPTRRSPGKCSRTWPTAPGASS